MVAGEDPDQEYFADGMVEDIITKDESENDFRRMASITWKYRFALCGTELQSGT